MRMKDTAGWVVTGALAGVAMFSLATARDPSPSMNEPLAAQGPALATLEDTATRNSADVLAEAYFSIARSEEAADPSQADWLIRHQMTLKGFDAEQGLNPVPETPDQHGLSSADTAALSNAHAALQRELLLTRQAGGARNGEIAALTAALQARYDWWVFGCEAAWATVRIEKARTLFEDTREALAHARARGALAVL